MRVYLILDYPLISRKIVNIVISACSLSVIKSALSRYLSVASLLRNPSVDAISGISRPVDDIGPHCIQFRMPSGAQQKTARIISSLLWGAPVSGFERKRE